MYGLLAVSATLILATRPHDGEPPKRTELQGRTELGRPILLVFLDGRLVNFHTTVSFWCPSQRVWRDGLWSQTQRGVISHPEERRFRVHQNGTLPDFEPPATLDYTMSGELAEHEASAKGTLTARAVFGRGHDSMYCRGAVSFSASERRQ